MEKREPSLALTSMMDENGQKTKNGNCNEKMRGKAKVKSRKCRLKTVANTWNIRLKVV